MEPKQPVEDIDFRKYWLILKRRWLPATTTFGVILALALSVAFTRKTLYQAKSQLLIKTDKSARLTGLNSEIGKTEVLGQKSDLLSTEASILSSRPILEKTIDSLDLRNETGELHKPGYIDSELEVKPIPTTDILTITYRNSEPELAAAVVNKLVDLYLENNNSTNRAEAITARQFIEEQLPQVEASVSQAEGELRRFKEENKVVELQQEAGRKLDTLKELDEEIALLEAQLANVTAQKTSLTSQLEMNAQEALAASALNQSPAVQQVLTALQEVQIELADAQSRYVESNSPEIARLKLEEAKLKSLLQGRIQTLDPQQPSGNNFQSGALEQELMAELVKLDTEQSGLTQQLSDLKNVRAAYRQQLDVLPSLENKQQELQRQVEAAQSAYENLLSRLKETQIAEDKNVGNARIISQAFVPEQPISSKRTLIIVAGGVVGILLGIANAFLLDLIDNSVHTVKDAEELFGYTLLGVIPAVDKFGKPSRGEEGLEGNIARIIVRDTPLSPIRDAYQMLQANLKFLNSDKEIKTLVITSSVAGEGKSEVAANLAVAIAQVGQRVLLVDANMRQPVQHHIWGSTNTIGLSNILVGEVGEREGMQAVMSGVDLLPSGVIPPNPAALLDSQRMKALVTMFSETYDYVIFDTPPLAGIADTTVLGKMVDGILLVVRPRVVDSARAKSAKDLLDHTDQNVLGIVANGVDVKSEPDSYFYYQEQKPKKLGEAARKSSLDDVSAQSSSV